MNIAPWNSQGPRPKRKEPQNHLLENQIDILALNETFLKPKFKFHPQGYDIHKNDTLLGTKGGVAILAKRCGPRANENFPPFSYLSDSKDQTIIEKVLLANDRGN